MAIRQAGSKASLGWAMVAALMGAAFVTMAARAALAAEAPQAPAPAAAAAAEDLDPIFQEALKDREKELELERLGLPPDAVADEDDALACASNPIVEAGQGSKGDALGATPDAGSSPAASDPTGKQGR